MRWTIIVWSEYRLSPVTANQNGCWDSNPDRNFRKVKSCSVERHPHKKSPNLGSRLVAKRLVPLAGDIRIPALNENQDFAPFCRLFNFVADGCATSINLYYNTLLAKAQFQSSTTFTVLERSPFLVINPCSCSMSRWYETTDVDEIPQPLAISRKLGE